MTQRTWIMMAAGGSAALMLGALAFQHIGGLAPCKLCIWQRYPHVIAIALGVVALFIPRVPILLMGALAVAITAGVGLYHAGVERGIFEGPNSCTSGPIGDISADDLLAQILTAPLIRCDDIQWQLFGLSMAGWNAVVSILLVGFWLKAMRIRP